MKLKKLQMKMRLVVPWLVELEKAQNDASFQVSLIEITVSTKNRGEIRTFSSNSVI
ncbi:uncharacterized protein DS421_17g582140 [Arachis hypogaea]|nr:uncharacterized protein DS421_17g582140 [Arachis hypogaea]